MDWNNREFIEHYCKKQKKIEQNMGFHFNYKIRGFNIGATFIQSNINGNYDKNILTYNQFDINKSDNQIIGTDYQYLLKKKKVKDVSFGRYNISTVSSHHLFKNCANMLKKNNSILVK